MFRISGVVINLQDLVVLMSTSQMVGRGKFGACSTFLNKGNVNDSRRSDVLRNFAVSLSVPTPKEEISKNYVWMIAAGGTHYITI